VCFGWIVMASQLAHFLQFVRRRAGQRQEPLHSFRVPVAVLLRPFRSTIHPLNPLDNAVPVADKAPFLAMSSASFGRTLALVLSAALGAVASAQCATTWRPADVGYGLGTAPLGGPTNVGAMARWLPDGSSAPSRERIVFGGRFSQLGVNVEYLVQFDPATTTWSPIGTGINGPVHELLPMSNGDLVARFTPPSSGQRIARFRNGAWQFIDANGTIGAADLEEMPNGDIVAASGNRVRRFNGTNWTQLGSVVNSVGDLVVRSNGRVLAVDRPPFGFQLLEFDGTDWSSVSATGLTQPTRFARAPNGDVLALSGDRLFRETASGWVSLGTATFGSFTATMHDLTVLPSGAVVIVGPFTAVNGVPASGIAKFDGTSWSPFPTGFKPNIANEAVASLGDGRVVGLAVLEGAPQSTVPGAWLQDGSSWISPVRGVRAVDRLIELRSGDLLAIAGEFPNGIGRFNGVHWRPEPNVSVGGEVRHMSELASGNVVVAGSGMNVSGQGPLNIALLGGQPVVPSQQQQPSGPVNVVLERPNGDLIAGGEFATVGGVTCNSISRFDGTSWHPLGLGLQRGNGSPGRVDDIVLMPNGHIVAAGEFASAGGNVAAFDGTSWRLVGGFGGVSSPVHAWSLEVHDNGDLTMLDAARQLHRLTGFGSAAEQWSPIDTSSLGGAPQSFVVLPNGDLLASGNFGGDPFARHGGSGWTKLNPWPVFWSAQPPRLESVGRSGTVFAVGDVFFGAGATSALQSTTGWGTIASSCPAVATRIAEGCQPGLEVVSKGWLGGQLRTRLPLGNSSVAVALIGFQRVDPALRLSLVVNSPPSCTLDVTNELEVPLLPGTDFLLRLPVNPALVGLVLFHQMLQLDFDPVSGLMWVQSTDALRLVIGQI
jgi:hypothetical protein